MIYSGIDLSLTGTGVILLEDGKLKHQKLIKTSPTEKNNHKAELVRLLKIINEIKVILSKFKPSIVVIEGLSMGLGKTRSIVQLSGLNYLVRNYLYENNIDFEIIPPTVLKKFISNKGNSPKELVLLETYKRYGVSFNDNNLCDAYILARIGEAIVEDIKLTKFQKEIINLMKKI